MVSFSVLIITHGREELLIKCLDSLRPPSGDWQLILLCNGKELSEFLIAKAKSLCPNLTLLHTPETFAPGKARNLALESVVKDWIFFLDDDASLLPGYWDLVLPLLEDQKIDVLGGPDTPAEGMSALSLSLAMALASPFCTGATFSRHQSLGKHLQLADEEKLTSCNLWVRKKALEDVSFPEDFIRAEETLFLQKLKKKGLSMYYHPRLKVAHFRRSHLSQLFRPTYYAGYYRSRLMKQKLATGGEIFWLPSLFVLLHALIIVSPDIFWSLVRVYSGMILFVSLGLSFRIKKVWLFPIIAFLHYFIVFMYGIGFLVERLGTLKRKP